MPKTRFAKVGARSWFPHRVEPHSYAQLAAASGLGSKTVTLMAYALARLRESFYDLD